MSASGYELGHLLRNKLAIILGMCELLSEKETDSETLGRVRQISEAATAMADVIGKDQAIGRPA